MSKQDTLSYYGNSIQPFFGVVEELLTESYVRVRIFGIHPIDRSMVPTDMLPPALVLYPTTGGQGGGGSLSHNLEVDSWVMGYFLDHPLCMQPIVTATIQGGTYSMSNSDYGGGEFVGQGGIGDNPAVDTTSTMSIPGGSTIEKSYNYIYSKLKAEGSSKDPHLHTCAALGVLLLETPNINPQVVGGYKGRAWGICQWLGSRRKQLFAMYGMTKDLGNQLDFMWWELNGTESRAKSAWLRATNMPDAVAGFCAFERAEEWQNGRVNRGHGNFKKRLQYAFRSYNSIKYEGEKPKMSPESAAASANNG
jgi:hypothetical protein